MQEALLAALHQLRVADAASLRGLSSPRCVYLQYACVCAWGEGARARYTRPISMISLQSVRPIHPRTHSATSGGKKASEHGQEDRRVAIAAVEEQLYDTIFERVLSPAHSEGKEVGM